MSSPSFLLANETNHALLQSLLESLNSIVEHQYSRMSPAICIRAPPALTLPDNPNLIYAIIKSRKRFEALRTFTLESGQEEIERLIQQRKETADGTDAASNSPRIPRNSSLDGVRSPQNARTPSLSNVPEEGGTFTIGEDDDSDDEEHREQSTPSQSSPSVHNSRNPSIASSVDDAVPLQLRGMSEKARGKMPAGQPSFSRQNSMSSLNSHNMVSGVSGFVPSAPWVCFRMSS